MIMMMMMVYFRCFESYFDLYLNNVERALQDQLKTRLIGDHTVNKSSLTNREFSDVFRDSNSKFCFLLKKRFRLSNELVTDFSHGFSSN